MSDLLVIISVSPVLKPAPASGPRSSTRQERTLPGVKSPPRESRAMATNYDDVGYEVTDGIATITMDRPEVYNAFTGDTVLEVTDAVRTAEEDPDCLL